MSDIRSNVMKMQQQGASLDEIEAYVKYKTAPQERSMGQELGRQAGLGARMVAEGVMALPNMVGDAANSAINLGIKGINKLSGANISEMRLPSEVMQSGLSAMGVPKPENIYERLANALGSAGTGAGMMGAAQGAVKGVKYVEPIVRELANSPALQIAGAGGGLLSTEAAKSSGVNDPLALAGAGIIGSIAPGSSVTTAQRTGNLAKSLVAPFTKPGMEEVAGMTLNRMATDRNISPLRMEIADELVKGSQPTMGQVSRDPGLISAEKAIGQAYDPQGQLLQRRSDQNAARQNALNDLILPSRPVEQGQKPARGTLEYAKAKRDATIEQNMEPAFAGFTPGADTRPIFNTIDAIAKNPRLGPRKDVQAALKFVNERLTQEGVDMTNPESLYAVRKDISHAIEGKYDSENPGLRLAAGQLSDIRKQMDAAIEAAAPGYGRYMELYRKRSIPLNQQEELARLRAGGQDIISDPVTGVKVLSPAKYQRTFEKMIADGSLKDARFSDNQITLMQNIASDLDRGASAQAATIRSPGSDTMRNLSVAAVIGRTIGKNFPDTPAGKAIQSAAFPLKWLYSIPDEQIGQIMLEAAKDPKLASRLMRRASKYEVEFIANELAKKAAPQATGQAMYGE